MFLAAVSVLASWGAVASATPVFTGPGVYEDTKRSIDIVDSHLQFLQAQAGDHALLGYFGVTSRWAPGRFLLNDGQLVAGNLDRTQANLGFGLGDLDTVGFFTGFNIDAVTVTNAFASKIPNFSPPASGQLFAFLGASIYDVQITFATMQNLINAGSFRRDNYGNFQATPAGPPAFGYRPGTPLSLSSPADNSAWFHHVLSFYEDRTGGFLSFVWAERHLPTEDGYSLSEVRANLQPLKHLVPKEFGLPVIGLDRLDRYKDYYQEAASYKQLVTQPTAAAAATPPKQSTPYEFELGSDDILAGGLRVHFVQQVLPSPKFRRAEVGYVQELPIRSFTTVRVGARAVAFERNSFQMAWDSYTLCSLFNKMAESGTFAIPLNVGLSYSFNSPDAATFLPIPYAHVFGIQVIIGKLETSRPLIPLIRAVEDREAKDHEAARSLPTLARRER